MFRIWYGRILIPKSIWYIFLLTRVAISTTGLLPHTNVVDIAMLCCESRSRIIPLFPHLPGVSLESMCSAFCFHHVMDVFDNDNSVILLALSPSLQSASYSLWGLWKTSRARCGSFNLFERAPAAPPKPLQDQSQVPHVPPPALSLCHSKPVCYSFQDNSLRWPHQFH